MHWSKVRVANQKALYGHIPKVVEKPLCAERTLCAERQLKNQFFIFLPLSNQVVTITTLWTHWVWELRASRLPPRCRSGVFLYRAPAARAPWSLIRRAFLEAGPCTLSLLYGRQQPTTRLATHLPRKECWPGSAAARREELSGPRCSRCPLVAQLAHALHRLIWIHLVIS